MAETSVQSPTEPQLPVAENTERGIRFSLLTVPVGIVMWVVLWRFGVIASFVSFAIGWLATFLYSKGAKSPVSKKAAPYVLAVILVGVALAFISGMASDAVDSYASQVHISPWHALITEDFWMNFTDNLLHNGELVSSYFDDMAWSFGFAILGCYSIVKSLFAPKPSAEAKNDEPSQEAVAPQK